MSKFEEIDEARRILGLRETATMAEIKRAYRNLVHRYHPDKKPNGEYEDERFRRVQRAYEMILDFCKNYRYSFTEDKVEDAYYNPYKRFNYNWH
jgi:DnaJ-class molecular chaperone